MRKRTSLSLGVGEKNAGRFRRGCHGHRECGRPSAFHCGRPYATRRPTRSPSNSRSESRVPVIVTVTMMSHLAHLQCGAVTVTGPSPRLRLRVGETRHGFELRNTSPFCSVYAIPHSSIAANIISRPSLNCKHYLALRLKRWEILPAKR